MLIGLTYCIAPYIIALQLEMMIIDKNDLIFKILKFAFIIFFIITNVNAFLINQLSASITVRKKSIHKYLYPGVGNDFFPGGVQGGGFGPRAQGGYQGGVDFRTQKLTDFDQNSNFSLF